MTHAWQQASAVRSQGVRAEMRGACSDPVLRVRTKQVLVPDVEPQNEAHFMFAR